MRNVIDQIVSALDETKRIRLLAISFDGAVIKFITSEESGAPAITRSVDTVQDWFGKHGLNEGQGYQSGEEDPRLGRSG